MWEQGWIRKRCQYLCLLIMSVSVFTYYQLLCAQLVSLYNSVHIVRFLLFNYLPIQNTYIYISIYVHTYLSTYVSIYIPYMSVSRFTSCCFTHHVTVLSRCHTHKDTSMMSGYTSPHREIQRDRYDMSSYCSLSIYTCV